MCYLCCRDTRHVHRQLKKKTELTLANGTRQMSIHYGWVEAQQQAVGMVAGVGS